MTEKIEVDLIIKAITEGFEKIKDDLGETATAEDKVTDSTGDVSLSMADLNAGIEIAQKAFQMLNQALDATVGFTVEYAKEVRDLSRTIGATPDDASKLIQVADDVNVSYGTLTSALEAGIRKGVKPTVDGLAQMADEYNAIQDPIERTKYLMDNFGRSGADLAPLMELGAAGIREAGDAAEAAGLVMNTQAVQAARNYEIAMDNLSDTIGGVKISIGNFLIPVLNQASDALNWILHGNELVNNALAEHADEVFNTSESYQDYSDELYRAADEAHRVVEANGDLYDENGNLIQSNYVLDEQEYKLAKSFKETADAGDDRKEAINEMAESAKSAADWFADLENRMSSLAYLMKGDLGNEIDDFNEKQGEITDKIGELQGSLSDLEQSYTDNTAAAQTDFADAILKIATDTDEKLQDLASSYSEKVQEAQDEITQIQNEATDKQSQIMVSYYERLNELEENHKEKVQSAKDTLAEYDENYKENSQERQETLQERIAELQDNAADKRKTLLANLAKAETDEDKATAQEKLDSLNTELAESIAKLEKNYAKQEEKAKKSYDKQVAALQKRMAEEQAEYEKQQAKLEQQRDKDATDAQKRSDEAIKRLQDRITKEDAAYQAQVSKINKLKDEQTAAEKQRLEDQTAKVDAEYEKQRAAIAGKISDLNTKFGENATKHEEATRRILFDMLQQSLSVDGLDAKEVAFLEKTATNWGLVDTATSDAWKEIQTYSDNIDAAIKKIDDLANKVSSIPGSKTIAVDVTYNSSNAPDWWQDWLDNPPADYATGGIVPPGFPNDTYPAMLSSYERVLTPGEQVDIANGLRAINNTLLNQRNSPTANEMAIAFAAKMAQFVG